MNSTVSNFFDKDITGRYRDQYRLDHGPRLQALLDAYDLKRQLIGKRVLDVGGGLGFLGELLDPSTDYTVVDGADVKPQQRLCLGTWVRADLDRDEFGSEDGDNCLARQPQFDAAFCLETLEHLSNPYHCLVEIKKLVKEGGDIFLSIPTEKVWHNVVYPGLLWPPVNFGVFLGQLALPLEDYYVYEPKDRGWPAYQFRCKNRPHSEKRMVFPKDEPKFRDCTILEATNL